MSGVHAQTQDHIEDFFVDDDDKDTAFKSYLDYGQYWPSTGRFQTTAIGSEYSAFFYFKLTETEKEALLRVDDYLELDFPIRGFKTASEWEGYSITTNLPGGVKDTGFNDKKNEPYPGVTGIKVSDLVAGVEYFAGINFSYLEVDQSDEKGPRVAFEWQVSHWASSSDLREMTSCARGFWSPEWCIFKTVSVNVSHGHTANEYGTGQGLPFDGYRFWEFSSASASQLPPAAPRPPLPAAATCADRGVPVITTPLTVSPMEADTTTPITYTVIITNTGCGTFAPENLAIGGYYADGKVIDVEQFPRFTLAPGASQTLSVTKVRDVAGQQDYAIAYKPVGRDWHPMYDANGSRGIVTQNVLPAESASAATASEPVPTETPNTGSTSAVIEPVETAEESQGQTVETANMDIGASGPNGHEIGAEFTVSMQDGSFIGSCTLQGNAGEPYPLSCQVPVPRYSIVVVTLDESTITPGLSPVENPIVFDTSTDPGAASHWGVRFQLETQSTSTVIGSTSDIAVVATENGAPVYDACFILLEYGNEGCDENQDGKITYEDVPLGTYTLHQTRELGAGRSVPDSTITVTGAADADGWERKHVSVQSAAITQPVNQPITQSSNSVDIALITRDPGDGHLLTGTCYVLVGHSNEGCDENGDGQVTFAQIPPGTYTVRQTKTPDGYATINDVQISVTDTGYGGAVPLSFLIKQAPLQNADGTRNVSIVFLDATTLERIPSGVCVQLAGASVVGCDEDLIDGQVDFLDVPAGGPYELIFSNLPSGYQVQSPSSMVVEAGTSDPTTTMLFVLLSESTGSGNPVIQPADSALSGTTQSSMNTDASTIATLKITMRGCPEGFNPNMDDYATNCTIPLDAPDASILLDLRMTSTTISGLEREYDGTYVYEASSPAATIILDGMAPVVRDSYSVFGHDSIDETGRYWINYSDGGTRHVFVYYYYAP